MNPKYLTVSALTTYIKTKLEMDTHLQVILLKGEVSNFKLHSRGHLYFSIKDDKAQINAIMFQSDAKNLDVLPKDGDHVLVIGKISLYEPSGSYSIQVSKLQLDGIGLLYQKYEALKKHLQELGYFESSHKKVIPNFPKTIGVVTSPTGAVIQDIMNTINRRYRLVEVILYPALVQGPTSSQSIAEQIRRANHESRCDVLIIGRGGGSIEDLWGFNEKIVADAIFESQIPIISAVGHETDVTIADFVSDLRAPTPTAAAELATPSKDILLPQIIEHANRLKSQLKDHIQNKILQIKYIEERLEISSPQNRLLQYKDQIRQYEEKIQLLMSYILNQKSTSFDHIYSKMIHPITIIEQKYDHIKRFEEKMMQAYYNKYKEALHQFTRLKDSLHLMSPLNVMNKGYGLITKGDHIITSIYDLKVGEKIDISIKDGQIQTEIKEIKEKTHGTIL